MSHEEEVKIIHTTGRNNCGGRCVIHAHVRDGKIEKLTTDTREAAGEGVPLTACVRGLNYHKTFLGEDRLRYPMKRSGPRGEGKFQRISWEEAVDVIASEWTRIRDTYGPGSRYVNYATGVSGLMRGSSLAKRLLALDGGFLDYYNSYSTACIRKATELMYGTCETGNSLEDWLNTNLIILWGHNPAETKFDCGTMYYLKKAKEKGIPIIVIDPRKNDTALWLDARWVPIRPATDSAMMDAMAYVIVEEGLQDRDFLDRCCVGFDREHMPPGIDPGECYLSYLTGERDGIPKTPQWAEEITGVRAEEIRELAVMYARARPAALIQGYGPQRHACGEQIARGGILLACLTGNVGVSGGWASGAADCSRHKNPAFPQVENPYGRKIPVFLWTEAVLRGHELGELDGVTDEKGAGAGLDSDIKMIVNLAGNCLINQHSHINRTSEILKDTSKCEFILCSDIFMTPSAKYADILLPGVSMFECENITMPWQYGDFLGFGNKAIEPLYECRFEYDWLREVAERLGLEQEFSRGRTAGQWLEHIYNCLREEEKELPDYQTFKEAGIYRYKNNPTVIAFENQRRDPGRYPFPTRSGKIEIFSEKAYRTEYRDFFPAIPRYVEPPEGPSDSLRSLYPLQLIGWHTKRRCHSIHDNNRAMDRVDPQRLWMHPADAQARALKDGDMALVWNDRGQVKVPVKVTDRIMEGVAALSQGAWYRPDKDGTDLAGSINVLTSLKPTPYARGNPQHTNLVEVRKDGERTGHARGHVRKNVAGYLLAGGEGRRMGGERKLFLEYEGEPFYRRVLRVLEGLSLSSISLSVEERLPYQELGIPLVVDKYPRTGPLGAVCAGLEQCQEEALLVMACDMPLVDGATAERLLEEYGRNPGIVLTEWEGRLFPFPGIYPKSALPALRGHLERGKRKMTEAAAAAGYRAVKAETGNMGLVNVNTPEEYRRLAESAAEENRQFGSGLPGGELPGEVSRQAEKKEGPYIFAVSGWKNSGKTTLITRLLPELTGRGYKVAVIKHDGHDFESDVPGTDTWHFQKAGAFGTGIYSSQRLMIAKECREPDEKVVMEAFGEADIILIEGLKHSDYPRYVCNYPEEEVISAKDLADRIEEGMRRNRSRGM